MQFGSCKTSEVLGVAVCCSHKSNGIICKFECWLIRRPDCRLAFPKLRADYEWDLVFARERPRLCGQVPLEF